MRYTSLLLSLLLGPYGGVLAQVSPSAMAGGITVRAGAVQAAPVPSGSDVWSGFTRSCTASPGAAWLHVDHAVTSTHVDLHWTLSSQAPATGTAASDGVIRYELWSLATVVGRLVVTWTNAITGSGTSSLGIDLLDDGSVDATGSCVLPVTFGPGGLPFRVHASCLCSAGVVHGPFGSSWSYSGSAQASLSIRFEPTHCQTMEVGAACGSPQLAAVGNLLQGVDVVGDFVPATDAAILVLGNVGTVLPLSLPPACNLLVAPVVTDWRLVDAQHRAIWAIYVPAVVRPLSFRVQMLGFDFDTFFLETSRALQVDCN